MDDLTQPPDNLPNLQHAMQRKLGRCLLQLQQYEKLLKAMVAQSSLSGPLAQLPTIRERMIQAVRQKTMGALVGMLTESYMTSPTSGGKPPPTEIDPGDEVWVSYQHELKISSEQYESTKSALKELVALRNDLVHHFIDRFDLWSTAGCAAAERFLDDCYDTIHHHYLNLRRWAKAMNETHAAMVQWLQSPDAEGMLWEDPLPASFDRADGEIQCCLRKAEAQLAKDGWAHLGAAILWIRNWAPEQTPKRYGYSSWRQVLHNSPEFETRIERVEGQPTVVWYRSVTWNTGVVQRSSHHSE